VTGFYHYGAYLSRFLKSRPICGNVGPYPENLDDRALLAKNRKRTSPLGATQRQRRIAMWSPPRARSTMMMRVFEALGCAAFDEPFYPYWLKTLNKVDDPGFRAALDHHETDWQKVVELVLGPIPDGRQWYYQKHMAIHMLDEVDLQWMHEVRNCFLIRNPAEVIVSMSQFRNLEPGKAQDVEEARRLFTKAGGFGRIVAKIERVEAIDAIDEIIQASDVVMVARGDLGVEMGYEHLTGLQKTIIRRTRRFNKVVITATQMMESMISHPIPTRAEVSDVSNAVMDGTDAVMLSAETAIGDYPVEVIVAVDSVCKGAETYALARGRTTHRLDDRFQIVDEAIAMAVMYTANHLDVKAIIALTESGSTTLWMSRIRSDIPIYAFTPHETTSRRVSLYRGVYPVSFEIEHEDPQRLYRDIFSTLLDNDLVEVGDMVIFTQGDLSGVKGSTNSMKIIQVTASD
jgi:hypothetical protein